MQITDSSIGVLFSDLGEQKKADIMPSKSVEEFTFKLCICNSTGV